MKKLLCAAAITANIGMAGQAVACAPGDLNGTWILDTVDIQAQKQTHGVRCDIVIQNSYMRETCNTSRLIDGTVSARNILVNNSLSQCVYTLRFVYYVEHVAHNVSLSRGGDTATGIFEYKYASYNGAPYEYSTFIMTKLQ
jgi:hypothetical protein